MRGRYDSSTITKIVRVGSYTPAWRKRGIDIFCRIEFKNNNTISITGVEGPTPSGNCVGSCGQIAWGYHHIIPEHNDPRYTHPVMPDEINFAKGWNADLWYGFLTIWKMYHNPVGHAACGHQRFMGWTWETHPKAACPICGYQLGTAWQPADIIPQAAIEFLLHLPNTDKTPAWV